MPRPTIFASSSIRAPPSRLPASATEKARRRYGSSVPVVSSITNWPAAICAYSAGAARTQREVGERMRDHLDHPGADVDIGRLSRIARTPRSSPRGETRNMTFACAHPIERAAAAARWRGAASGRRRSPPRSRPACCSRPSRTLLFVLNARVDALRAAAAPLSCSPCARARPAADAPTHGVGGRAAARCCRGASWCWSRPAPSATGSTLPPTPTTCRRGSTRSSSAPRSGSAPRPALLHRTAAHAAPPALRRAQLGAVGLVALGTLAMVDRRTSARPLEVAPPRWVEMESEPAAAGGDRAAGRDARPAAAAQRAGQAPGLRRPPRDGCERAARRLLAGAPPSGAAGRPRLPFRHGLADEEIRGPFLRPAGAAAPAAARRRLRRLGASVAYAPASRRAIATALWEILDGAGLARSVVGWPASTAATPRRARGAARLVLRRSRPGGRDRAAPPAAPTLAAARPPMRRSPTRWRRSQLALVADRRRPRRSRASARRARAAPDRELRRPARTARGPRGSVRRVRRRDSTASRSGERAAAQLVTYFAVSTRAREPLDRSRRRACSSSPRPGAWRLPRE